MRILFEEKSEYEEAKTISLLSTYKFGIKREISKLKFQALALRQSEGLAF